MQNSIFNKNNDLNTNAKELRKNMTKHEKHLWYDFLKTHRFGWRRQQIIDSYITDFYCPKALLAIELDGSQHYDDKAMLYDKTRTEKIEKYDIEVLRFSNLEIDKRFSDVCQTIDCIAEDRIREISGKKRL